MMRSLWTAASGMTAQQFNVDTISNNLANVNTSGYKAERADFASLLYDTMQRANLDPSNNTGRPVNLQVGLGVRPIATTRDYSQGNLQTTSNPFDLGIEGPGFFVVQRGDGDVAYTQDGSLKTTPTDNGNMLVTNEGFQILDINDQPIYLPSEVSASSVNVDTSGEISYTSGGVSTDTGVKINLVQFPNPEGLNAIGQNQYQVTPASGDPILESSGTLSTTSVIRQGVLQMSNVQVSTEMVNLIVAQRSYELNSKAITTSDEMLQTANNLKR